jgi:lipooligosaccharide transport system permease protein
MSVTAILIVILALGFGHSWLAIFVLPLGFVTGLAFAGFGLIMTALARNYDFFTYSLTLFQTPMLLLSGVFFPVDQMPAPLQAVAAVLPLSHAIDIARPLLAGRVPGNLLLHVAILLGYALVSYWIAVVLTRRRLLK